MPPYRRVSQYAVLDPKAVMKLAGCGFLHVLFELEGWMFVIPGQMRGLVCERRQRDQLNTAIRAGWIKRLVITDPSELELYSSYRSRFDAAESACLAAALSRGWAIVSEDSAIRREATSRFGENGCLDVKLITREAVAKGILTETQYEKMCKQLYCKKRRSAV